MKGRGVLLADDHALVRAGLRLVIEKLDGFSVVAEVADGREAVAQARRLAPDLALLDVTMPGMGGLDACAEIRRLSPSTRVIMLSMHSVAQYVSAALQAGAAGYLVKDAAEDELAAALRTVAEGGTYISRQVAQHVVQGYARALRGESAQVELSTRQRQVLQQIAEGRSTREIAEAMHLSAKTVETHRAELMRKLGIFDVAGLTRYAIRIGLVSSER